LFLCVTVFYELYGLYSIEFQDGYEFWEVC
jgi:hypothetical protein